MFEGFKLTRIDTGEADLRVRVGATGHPCYCFTATRRPTLCGTRWLRGLHMTSLW
jgi:hypothetical protein